MTAVFDIGFDFARALRDPALRARLHRIGHDETTVAELVQRVYREPGRYLVARPDIREPCGWHLTWLEIPDES